MKAKRFTPMALCRGLRLNKGEILALRQTADDCHLGIVEYVRIMTLMAAGCGGIAEHLERASNASWDAEAIAHGRMAKKRRDPGMPF